MAEGKEFNARTEIMHLIAKTNDDERRMIWMMMLGILEQQEKGFERIDKKLDAILQDEETLRKSVLNGHADSHHDDHNWIQERRKSDCASACEWARGKMVAEQQDAKDAADLVRAGKKAAVEQAVRTVVLAALFFIAGAIGMAHYLK